LAGISLLSFDFYFSLGLKIKQKSQVDLADDFKEMFKLFAKLLTIVFVISAFLFVMIEQGIMTWLPTFNDKVHLPENISIMMASILAISLAVGRLVAGVITKKKLDMGSQLLYRYGNVSCGFVLPKRWA
jgi:hypothetical protein